MINFYDFYEGTVLWLDFLYEKWSSEGTIL